MNSDLTFITNEENKNLLERFKVLIRYTRFFDVLVGYFYTSGFHAVKIGQWRVRPEDLGSFIKSRRNV